MNESQISSIIRLVSGSRWDILERMMGLIEAFNFSNSSGSAINAKLYHICGYKAIDLWIKIERPANAGLLTYSFSDVSSSNILSSSSSSATAVSKVIFFEPLPQSFGSSPAMRRAMFCLCLQNEMSG